MLNKNGQEKRQDVTQASAPQQKQEEVLEDQETDGKSTSIK